MKKLVQLLMLISLGLFMNSCYYDAYPEYDIDEPDIVIPTEVSFQSDIQPLFARCTGCHKGAYPNPDLRSGSSFGSLVPEFVTSGSAANSKLYNYLPGNGHHDVGFTLNSGEIALIEAWIDQGANNN